MYILFEIRGISLHLLKRVNLHEKVFLKYNVLTKIKTSYLGNGISVNPRRTFKRPLFSKQPWNHRGIKVL